MIFNEVLIYIWKVALSIGGFYLFYRFLFKTGHHFQFNRFLILTALTFSFVFPFVSFDLPQTPFQPINQFEFQPIVDFWEIETVESSEVIAKPVTKAFNPFLWLFLIYCFGVILFAIRYVTKLLSITKLIRKNELIKKDNYFYVKLKEGHPTFSFRNYIFTDSQSLTDGNKAMFVHEQCHVDQKHTYDLLLVELLLIIQWFNPFIYLFKHRLAEVHEFLADDRVLQNGYEKQHYLKLLFASVGRNFTLDFASHFDSNLKKRIVMINRNKTIKLKAWKIVFPCLFGAMIIALHSGFSSQNLSFAEKIEEVNDGGQNLNIADTIEHNNEGDPTFNHPVRKEESIRLASGYGMRMHPILKYKRMHSGIDYSANPGVNIHASAGGIVRVAEYQGSFGNRVVIDHKNGFSSVYNHMASIIAQAGDKVSSGQVIGTVGNTGLSAAPHLHFEIWKDGNHVNPMDYLEPYQ